MKTIIEMAREAGGGLSCIAEPLEHPWKFSQDELERFAALVRAEAQAEEREAMVAESAKKGWGMRNDDPFEDCVREIADIRARGNT